MKAFVQNVRKPIHRDGVVQTTRTGAVADSRQFDAAATE